MADATEIRLYENSDSDYLTYEIKRQFIMSGESDSWFKIVMTNSSNRETVYIDEYFVYGDPNSMLKDKVSKILELYHDWLVKIGVWKNAPEPPTDRPILDTGARREFKTGSRRDVAAGKGRYDLLPFTVIDALAKHFEKGAAKYGDRNWEKGQPLSVFADSGLRHAFKGVRGESDEDHIIAAIWNFMAYWWTQDKIRKGELPIELGDAGEIRREQTLTKDKK